MFSNVKERKIELISQKTIKTKSFDIFRSFFLLFHSMPRKKQGFAFLIVRPAFAFLAWERDSFTIT